MKKILFSVLMFLSIPVFAGISSYFPYGLKASTITVVGGLTVGTASKTLVVDSVNHRVGISTGTPTTTLEINGITTLGGNSSSLIYPLIVKNNSTGGAADVAIQFATGGGAPYIGATRYQGTVGSDGLFIRDTAGLEIARFARGGNVGIGTANPTERLEVAGNIKSDYGIIASSITLGGFTYTYPSSLGASSQQLTLDSVYTSSATLKWATPAGGGDVLAAGNNTMSGTNNFTGTVQIGGAVAYIPVIVASGTMHEVASKTFNVSFQDNRRYELVFISTCTTGDVWGARFNGDTASHYAHARTYTFSNGTGGDVSAESYAYFADNYGATTNLYTLKASMQIRLNDPLASVTIDWQSGIGAIGQGNATNSGHSSWSVANTLPTTMTLVHMSGTCSGAYIITTTAWDASF